MFLAAGRAYGPKLVVDVLPGVVPGFAALEPLYYLFQPGTCGNLLVFGLALARPLEAVSIPDRIRDPTDARSVRSDGSGESCGKE